MGLIPPVGAQQAKFFEANVLSNHFQPNEAINVIPLKSVSAISLKSIIVVQMGLLEFCKWLTVSDLRCIWNLTEPVAVEFIAHASANRYLALPAISRKGIAFRESSCCSDHV